MAVLMFLTALVVGLSLAQNCTTLHGAIQNRYYTVKSPGEQNFTGVITVYMRRGEKTKKTDEILWVTGKQYRPMVLKVLDNGTVELYSYPPRSHMPHMTVLHSVFAEHQDEFWFQTWGTTVAFGVPGITQNVIYEGSTKIEFENRMLSLQNITMCVEPVPVLLDTSTVYFGLLKIGQNVTLSCAAKGAPFLEAHWEGPNGRSIRSDKIYQEEVESEHQITNFNHSTDSGVWKCHFQNINFPELASGERTFYLSSLVAKPNATLSVDTNYQWVVDAWPGAYFTISCSVQVTKMEVSPRENLVSYIVTHQLVFDQNLVHQAECALVLRSGNQSWRTEKVLLKRECPINEKYWNKQGMCVSCPPLHHLVEIESLESVVESIYGQLNKDERCKLNVLSVVMVFFACLVLIAIIAYITVLVQKNLNNKYNKISDLDTKNQIKPTGRNRT